MLRIVSLGNGIIAVAGKAGLNQDAREISVFNSKTWAGSSVQLPEAIEQLVAGPDGGIVATWRTGVLYFDRNGRLLWARHFLFNPYGKIKGLAAAPEGGAYVVGETYHPHEKRYKNSINNVDAHGFIVRIDRRGAILWSRAFVVGENKYVGADWAAPGPNGGVFIVAGGDVLRLDAAGNLVWAKYLNIDATYHFANIVSGDGKLVLGGTVWRAGVHGSDALVVSIGLDGQNSKAIAIDVGATDSIGDVISTGGKMVAAGMTQRMGPTLEDTVHHKEAWMVALEPDGRVDWSISIGTDQGELQFVDAATIDENAVVFGVGSAILSSAERRSIVVRLPVSSGEPSAACEMIQRAEARTDSFDVELDPIIVRLADIKIENSLVYPTLTVAETSFEKLCGN